MTSSSRPWSSSGHSTPASFEAFLSAQADLGTKSRPALRADPRLTPPHRDEQGAQADALVGRRLARRRWAVGARRAGDGVRRRVVGSRDAAVRHCDLHGGLLLPRARHHRRSGAVAADRVGPPIGWDRGVRRRWRTACRGRVRDRGLVLRPLRHRGPRDARSQRTHRHARRRAGSTATSATRCTSAWPP